MKRTVCYITVLLIYISISAEFAVGQNSYGWERIYNSIYGIDGAYTNGNTTGTKLWIIRPVRNLLGTGYYDFIRYHESSNSWSPASHSIFKAVYYSYYIGYTISGYEYPPSFAVSSADTNFILVNTTVEHQGAPPYDKRLYYSYDNGLNRADIVDFQLKVFHALAINPRNDSICYASYGDSIVISDDRGVSWSRHSALAGFSGSLMINPTDTNILYAVDDSLWLSSNGGLDFHVASGKKFSNMIFINSGAVILAVSGKVLYASTDRGFTWAVRDSLAEIITAVDADPDSESIVYAGTSKGLYRSADSGYTFQLFNNAFSPSRKVIFLCKQPGANYVYAVTEEAVYKCWFSFLVNTNENSEALPLSFKLQQNFPNPFNPVTTISYDLPKSGFVTLKVYDMLGREVKTLVNEMKTAGFHKAQFTAEKLPSGAYFYRLSVSSNAGEFVAVRKCIILK